MSATRPHNCNVLELGSSGGRIWRFATGGNQAETLGELKVPAGSTFPQQTVGKSFNQFWQPRLNILWVPPRGVFLRVVDFPACSYEELCGMVELQLEKLSPLPVNQIVWSVEPVSGAGRAEGMQTVVVMVASRNEIEKVLADAELMGVHTDRVEVPFLHQLLQSPPGTDGAWLYIFRDDAGSYGLTVWWSGGKLCNLSLLHLTSPENWESELEAETSRIAWAGELEGWLGGAPNWHLVADAAAAEVWGPILSRHSDLPVRVVPPVEPAGLALLSANRAASGASHANLISPEVRSNYPQQYKDRLWVSSLMALMVVYLMIVAIYAGAVQVLKFQKNRLDSQIAELDKNYGRAVELKVRNRILNEQITLRFAALDAWKIATEKLPSELTLGSVVFQRGKRLLLSGTAAADNLAKITEYNEALSKHQENGKPYFSDVSPPTSRQEGNGPGGRWNWSFSCDLKTSEEP